MREVYRKFGRVARWEHGVRIDVTETGEAIETDETFIATPLRECGPDIPVWPDLTEWPDKNVWPTHVERLVITHGIAIHQFNDVEWCEETRRVHVSLTHDKIRALIDLDRFDFDLVRGVAGRLTNTGEMPERIRVAPHVVNAIIHTLPNLWQRAGGRDGKGQLIEEMPASQSKSWYRPSYRVRPIRKALNLAVRAKRTEIDGSLPRAVAVIDGGFLIDDGRNVYPAIAKIVSVEAVSPDGEIESRCR